MIFPWFQSAAIMNRRRIIRPKDTGVVGQRPRPSSALLRPPSVLYPSADGVKLLQLLSQSNSASQSITKTTTAKPPPQPVLWFPNNNADCGGSTKGMTTVYKSCSPFCNMKLWK